MLNFFSLSDRRPGIQRGAFIYADGAAVDLVEAVNRGINPDDDTPPDLIGYIGTLPTRPGIYPCELYGLPAELVLRPKSDDACSIVRLVAGPG